MRHNPWYRIGFIGVAIATSVPAAAQSVVQSYDIASQDLSSALRHFSRISDREVLFSQDLVLGKKSPGVRGKHTAEQALHILLRGTGLKATVTASGPLLISANEPDDESDIVSAHTEEASDIIVTAQRREQRLNDVPVSVTVTTGEALAQANISGIADLGSRMPNIRVTQAPASAQLHIRGVGSGLNAGFEQAVGTFVDGVYRGRSRAMGAALFDLERVELLKGPQTTFFGNNVIAGALNIVTRKPTNSLEGNASISYAPADDEYVVEAGITAPVADNFSVRVAGKAFGMNGFSFNEATGENVPHQRDWIVRGSMRWEPTENWRSDLRVDRGQLRDRGSPASEGLYCPADPVFGAPRGTCLRYLNSVRPVDDEFDYKLSNIPTRNFYDFVEVGLTNSIEFPSGTLSTVSGYFYHSADLLTDTGPFPVGGVPANTASPTMNRATETADQFSQEVRFASTEDRVISYMLGGYFAREELEGSAYNAFYQGAFGTVAAPTYSASSRIAAGRTVLQNSTTLSAFGSLTANLSDAIKVDLGLRYTRVLKTAHRTFRYGLGGFIVGPDDFIPGPDAVQAPLAALLGGEFGDFARPRRVDDKLMPSVKFRYNFAPDIMAYASYTKGFKAGGYANDPRGYEFNPEGVDAYEVGLKASLFARRLFTSLTFFRSDYTDLQEATQTVLPSGAIISIIGNAAAARSQGVEFSSALRLSRAFAINADIAYLDSKYTSYPGAPCTTLGNLVANCSQDMTGNRRAFAPRVSGNVGASVAIPLANEMELRFDPSLYFTSRFFQSATADPLLSQPGYAKLDARVSFGADDRSWEIAVIGKNLTNRRTAAFRNNFAGSPGSIWVFADRPRSIALQISMKY